MTAIPHEAPIDRVAATWGRPLAIGAGVLVLSVGAPMLVDVARPVFEPGSVREIVDAVGRALIAAVGPGYVLVAAMVLARMAWRWRTAPFVDQETAAGFQSIGGFLFQAAGFAALIAPTLLAWIDGRAAVVIDLSIFVAWTFAGAVAAVVIAQLVREVAAARADDALVI